MKAKCNSFCRAVDRLFGMVICTGTVLLIASSAQAQNTSAQVLTYQLLPGSTITPNNGPTEALTGSFQWVPSPLPGFNEEIFQPVSFNLSSASCTLSLYGGTQFNSAADLGSDVFAFAINVQATGLSISSGTILEYPNDGTYTGSPYAPTQIILPSLKIAPIGGGSYAASLNFTAALVPEPSPSVLLAVGLLLVLARTLQRQRKIAAPAVI
jgi:hypothetical protein